MYGRAALAEQEHVGTDSLLFDRLTKAVGALLDQRRRAGEIRSDISPEDLLAGLVGMCYLHDQPLQKSVVRCSRLCRRPSCQNRPGE